MAVGDTMTQLEKDTVNRLIQAAQLVVRQFEPLAKELNILTNAAGGVMATITQDKLTTAKNLGGLTSQQLADANFALTTTLLNDITTAFAQLAQLAGRNQG